MRKPIIYFSRVGMAKDGRGLYKLSDGNGKTYGRRFKIYPQPRAQHQREGRET